MNLLLLHLAIKLDQTQLKVKYLSVRRRKEFLFKRDRCYGQRRKQCDNVVNLI